MPILSLDVSSTASGWAFIEPPEKLLAFGVERPRSGIGVVSRIDEMVRLIDVLAGRMEVSVILFEWSAGKVYRRASNASGLSVLGAAQGAVRQRLLDRGLPVETVLDLDWTQGIPKKRRARTIALAFPAYAAFARARKDAGLDVADSIGLALYWIGRQRIREIIRRGTAR